MVPTICITHHWHELLICLDFAQVVENPPQWAANPIEEGMDRSVQLSTPFKASDSNPPEGGTDLALFVPAVSQQAVPSLARYAPLSFLGVRSDAFSSTYGATTPALMDVVWNFLRRDCKWSLDCSQVHVGCPQGCET